MVTNEIKLYDLDGIDLSTVKCLRKYRKIQSVGELLQLSEASLKMVPMVGAKRYEELVATLNKNGVDHSYSEFYDEKISPRTTKYANTDIRRLPVKKYIILDLIKLGIKDITVLEKMSITDMIERGMTDDLIKGVVAGLIKFYRIKRQVNCDQSIDVLHIRRSSALALHRAGIDTIDQLSMMTRFEIERVDGIGCSSRKEIITALQSYLKSVGLLNTE